MDEHGLKAEQMDQQSSKKKKASTPSANDPIENITSEAKGLFEDLTSWMELKIQYVILDYKEQAIQKALGIGLEIGALVLLGIAGFFGLIALALGLGTWLNHPAWGFLIVMGLLSIVALILGAIGKRARAPREKEKEIQSIDISEETPKLPGPRIPENISSQNGKG